MTGDKVRFSSCLRIAVPGADELAVIASENAVAHGWSQRFRDAATVFDRQVGDAASGIELTRAGNRLCRANRDAGRATSAQIFDRWCLVHREGKVGQDLAQEEP